MIKAVVFDFDGTLADTLPLKYEAIRKLAKQELHREYTEKDLAKARDMGIKELLKTEHIPLFRLPYYASRIESQVKPKLKDAKLFSGTRQLLNKLSKSYQLGILSSSPKENIQTVLKNQRINSISFIFTGSPLFGKHIAIRHMLCSAQLKKDEVIYLGDELRDIAACRKAGIRIISVSWGYNSRKRLLQEKPDYIADTRKDIIKILDSLNKRQVRHA